MKKKFETAGLKKSYDINRHSKNQNNNNVNQGKNYSHNILKDSENIIEKKINNNLYNS